MALNLVRGWFAEPVDSSQEEDGLLWGKWHPSIQIEGAVFPLPVYLDSQEKCEAFIRRDLVPAGGVWLDGPRRYPCPDCRQEGWCMSLVTGEKRLTYHAERLEYLRGRWPE